MTDPMPTGSIPAAEYARLMAAQMTERTFQAAVENAALRAGWLVYHTHDSRRSHAGFPDLVLVHARRRLLLFRELKTQTGKTTPAQQRWLTSLTAAGADAAVWRPLDWHTHLIHRTLTGDHE